MAPLQLIDSQLTTTMSFHMSLSSGSTTSTTKPKYRQFASKAEFDEWIAEVGKKNAAGLRAAGIPTIDLNVRRL
jgi:hypothetical protein